MKKFNQSLNVIFTLLFTIIVGVTYYGSISPKQAYTIIAILLMATMLYSSYIVIKNKSNFSLGKLLGLLLFFVTVVVACFDVLLTNLTTA